MRFPETDLLENFTLELGRSSEIGLGVALAMMMFAVALGLRPAHFEFFKNSPRVFVAGLVGQLLVLPVLTLALCFLLAPPTSVALGMILIACCPGGNVSNLLVLMARGNAALSVSLTATSSIAAAFITPLAIVFWCGLYPPTASLLTEIEFDRTDFLIQTAIVLALPLVLGMLLAVSLPDLAARIRKPLVLLGGGGLLAIIALGTWKYLEQFLTIGVGLIGLVLLHNACAFLAGNGVARLVRAGRSSSIAITYEVGIQNTGLGIVILLTQLGGLGGAAAVAGLWGIWHIIAGLLLVLIFRASSKRAERV